ncbi:MAG: hypothetical protein AB7S26_13390 [Sandaracinaceae bacterium]
MTPSRFVAPALAALFVLAHASAAYACPVCFQSNEANRDAFLLTTAILSLVPLAMIFGLAFVLIRRERAAQAEARREEAEAAPT